MNKKQQLTLLRVVVHIGALLPLVLLYIDYYTYNLGVDEIDTAIARTGQAGLWLLVISLAITPLRIFFGWNILLPLRKPLGLYSFMYVSLHLAIFAWLDYGLELGIVWTEIVSRRYALVGFAAFLILLPLAITSTKWAQRKLGKRWKKLHQWVYLAGILAVVHYIWLVKNDYTRPFLFAIVLAIFLIVRLDWFKTRITSFRKGLSSRSAKARGSSA